MAAERVTLDLGVSDVHVPGAVNNEKRRRMGEISTKQRKALPRSAFGDPENRAYPLPDKAHADNAMARLEQQKGSMSSSKYRSIKARIRSAQRRFGEESKKATMPRGGRLRVTLDHPTHGRLEVRHMNDGEDVAVLPPVDISQTVT